MCHYFKSCSVCIFKIREENLSGFLSCVQLVFQKSLSVRPTSACQCVRVIYCTFKINIEFVEIATYLHYTSLPWVLSNTPAEYQVAQMDRGSLLYSQIVFTFLFEHSVDQNIKCLILSTQ